MAKIIDIKPTKESNAEDTAKLARGIKQFEAEDLVRDSRDDQGRLILNSPLTPEDAESNELIPDNGETESLPPMSDYFEFKYKKGIAPLTRGSYGREAMYGRMEIGEALQKGDLAYLQQVEDAGRIREISFKEAPFRKLVGEGIEMFPFMMESVSNGLATGMLFGGEYAIAAGLAGQIPPFTVTPEELITVPVAFAGGMAQGMTFGIIKTSLDVEGGNLFLDLSAKEVSPEVARPLAIGAGLAIGVIEASQLKLFAAPFKVAFNKMLKSATAKTALKKTLTAYFKNVGIQVGQEELQEIVTIATEILAGHIENDPNVAPEPEEIKERLVQTAIKATQGIAALNVPGAAVSLASATDIAKESVDFAKKIKEEKGFVRIRKGDETDGKKDKEISESKQEDKGKEKPEPKRAKEDVRGETSKATPSPVTPITSEQLQEEFNLSKEEADNIVEGTKKETEKSLAEELEDLQEDTIKQFIGEQSEQTQEAEETTEVLEKLRKESEQILKNIISKPNDKIQADIKAGSKPLIQNDNIDNFDNFLSAAFYNVKKKFFALQPMDVVFDLMDTAASFTGVNYRFFKKPMNIANRNRAADLRDTKAEVVDFHEHSGLEQENYVKILVFATLQQDKTAGNSNGRNKLLRTFTEAQLAKFEKDGLTADETKMLGLMQKQFELLKPRLAKVMKEVFGREFTAVEDFFPMLTDFDAMDDVEIANFFGEDAKLHDDMKTVSASFLTERKGGAVPIKTNALQAFLNHVENATYAIHMAELIEKQLQVADTVEYRNAVGKSGQEAVLSWLRLMARKGGAGQGRIASLDWLRENSSIAILGYKLSTILIQPTALLDGATIIQGYAFKGLNNITLGIQANEWRAFVSKFSIEIQQRRADDPAFAAFMDNILDKSMFGKVKKHAFAGVRAVDGIIAAGVFAGAYEKIVTEKGNKVDFANPDLDAILEAELIVRRSQASGQSIDLPAAISQGALTGNVSIDKAITQFQTFIFGRSSIVVQSLAKNGLKNTPEIRNIATFLTLALIAEVLIRRGAEEIIATLTGDDPDEPLSDIFFTKFIQESISSIPIVGQVVGGIRYNSPPVPVLSLAHRAAKNAGVAMTTKDDRKKRLASARTILEVAGLLGVAPGSNQIDQIIRDTYKTKRRKK